MGYVNLVERLKHEPCARKIGQPLPTLSTSNELYLYLYTYTYRKEYYNTLVLI